ncbi:4Fe-4S binding protein [candidate division KSB1 bacterium]|nr:4Fe-4S binding protein [candidate division KSB1 bacterium]
MDNNILREILSLLFSERVSSVNKDICLGCGVCISACEKNAISLIPRKNPTIPKGTIRELYKTILREKGRLTTFIVNRFNREVDKFLQ